MTKISKSDFIEGLKKSGLIDAQRLAKFLENITEDSAQGVAKQLIREEIATRWQAKYLLSGRTRLDIGSYRLLERINRNELGDRFLGFHTSLARKVDIQVLPGSLTKDKKSCDEFIQKASLAATLDHPNLTHVYDIDQEGGRFFLVTEHVDGVSIDQVDQKNLSETKIARIVSQAIEGITYAHQNKVIHGCISPSDVFLDADQQVKIQHLPLSPLRRQSSGTNGTPTEAMDFSAIASIGEELLSKSKSVDAARREILQAAFANLKTGNAESIAAATTCLTELVAADDIALDEPSSEGFSGGFDQPIATSDSPRLRKKPAKQESEEPESVEAEPGFIGRLWQNNPVAAIATAAVLTLLIIGGIVFGSMKLFGGPGSPVVEKNQKKSQINQSADPKPELDQVNDKDKETEKPEAIPSPEEMESFLADIGNDKKGHPKEKGKAPGTEPAGEPQTSPPDTTTTPKVGNNAAVGNPGDVEDPANLPGESSHLMVFNPVTPGPHPIAPEPEVRIDLENIRGIGEKTKAVLNEGGVISMQQIAAMSPNEISAAIIKGGWSTANKMDEYKNWIEQSKNILGDETPVKENAAITAPEDPGVETTPPPNTNGPFGSFPRVVELPALEETTEVKIGDLVISAQFLLGAELVCEEGFAKGKLSFELERTEDDKQKWLVGLKRSERHDPIHVAFFRKSDDAFYFQWLPEAATDKNAKKLSDYLRNCYLKLVLPENQTTYVTLRQPIKIPDLRLTAKDPGNRLEFSIPAMPDDATIVVEVLPLRIKDVDTNVINSRIERNQPATIWLKKQDKTGFMWLQVAGDLRGKLKLQSNLMLLIHGQAQPVHSLSALDDLARSIDMAAVQAQNLHDQFTKPPSMTKTDFDAKKAELLKDAKAKQVIKDKIIEYSQIVPQILDQPITVRVYAKLGKLQTILAVTDSSIAQETGK